MLDSLVTKNLGIFFEMLNETEDDLERFFLKEKEDYRRKLFFFWHLAGFFEAHMSGHAEPLFPRFYEEFYKTTDFLNYEIEKSYNIVDREFFTVLLKVNIADRLIKKQWWVNQLPSSV